MTCQKTNEGKSVNWQGTSCSYSKLSHRKDCQNRNGDVEQKIDALKLKYFPLREADLEAPEMLNFPRLQLTRVASRKNASKALLFKNKNITLCCKKGQFLGLCW